jgi:hypothetical protein
MTETHRVIVTGTNAAGKSLMVEDIQAEMKGPSNFDFWQTKADCLQHYLSAGRSPMKFFPAQGGTMFRLFTIPPVDQNMDPAEIATMQDWFFKEVGDPNARVDTTRHPLMHTTPTIDYILLLSVRPL